MKLLETIFLFISQNYYEIIALIVIIIGIIIKVKRTINNGIDLSLEQLENTILEKVSKAEIDYSSFKNAGEIKRAQVINQIYKEYPNLSKYMDQDTLISYIDKLIDKALEEVDKVISDKATEILENKK